MVVPVEGVQVSVGFVFVVFVCCWVWLFFFLFVVCLLGRCVITLGKPLHFMQYTYLLLGPTKRIAITALTARAEKSVDQLPA